MHIVVCIKQVPDTVDVKIDPLTKNLVREGIPSIMNPSDMNAIEAALQLREKAGGSVTLVSMGPPQAAKELEYGLGMGADEAFLLCDRSLSGSDTLATGYALSHVISTLGPYDLILCGNEAIDGCTGQVGPSIAEHLGIAAFTSVLEIDLEGSTAIVKRDIGSYVDVYEAKLPILACAVKGVNTPRAPRETDKRVKQVDASGMDKGRIGIEGSPTRVVQISVSERMKSYVDIDSSLSCEQRIECIINGGLEKKAVKLMRGTAACLAAAIWDEDDLFDLYSK